MNSAGVIRGSCADSSTQVLMMMSRTCQGKEEFCGDEEGKSGGGQKVDRKKEREKGTHWIRLYCISPWLKDGKVGRCEAREGVGGDGETPKMLGLGLGRGVTPLPPSCITQTADARSPPRVEGRCREGHSPTLPPDQINAQI